MIHNDRVTAKSAKTGSRRAVTVVVIVLLVLAAAGVVYLLLPGAKQRAEAQPAAPSSSAQPSGPMPENLALAVPERTERAGEQVAKAISAAYSYDSTKLDRHRAQIDGVIAGTARQELERSLAGLRGKPATTVTTTVTKRAVTKLTEDTARVLVVLNEQVHSGGKTQDVPARMLVSARHQGALWQITETDSRFERPQSPPYTGGVVPLKHAENDPMRRADQRDVLLGTAMRDAERFTSVDYRDPDKSLDETIAVTTGKLREQAQASKRANAAKMAERQLIIEAHTAAAGVRRMDLRAGSADVLVALNSKVTAPNGDQGQTPSTVELRMRLDGKQWLVENVQNL